MQNMAYVCVDSCELEIEGELIKVPLGYAGWLEEPCI